jgi:hypothetical protein
MKPINPLITLDLLQTGESFGSLVKYASIFGLASSPILIKANSKQGSADTSDLETWFDKMNGKHKIVFDVITVND